jgi:hypothetical protein
MESFINVEGENLVIYHTWKCPVGCQGCDCPCHGEAASDAQPSHS